MTQMICVVSEQQYRKCTRCLAFEKKKNTQETAVISL